MDVLQCSGESTTSYSMDSSIAGDSKGVKFGSPVSADIIGLADESKNETDDAGHVGSANEEHSMAGNTVLCTIEKEEQSFVTAAKVPEADELSVVCWNDLTTVIPAEGYFHESRENTDFGYVSCIGDVINDGYDGSSDSHFVVSDDAWKDAAFVAAEIVCDYISVRDDESINLEGLLTLSHDEDQNKLLGDEVTACTQTAQFTTLSGFTDSMKNYDTTTSSNSESMDTFSGSVDSPSDASESSVSDYTSYKLSPEPVLANGQLAPFQKQIQEVSDCQFSLITDLSANVLQHPPSVGIFPPAFSLLPSRTSSGLPSLPFPPIFYICRDKKPLLDVGEPYIIEMQNIVQKSELSNVAPHFVERCDSQLSTFSEKLDICRICHCEGDASNKLISPCLCSGSLKYIHLSCLQKWIKSSDKKSCELCSFDYIMTMKTRPFKRWEKLDMTIAERRKIICSVTFHVIAITCVIWSLYVLIDRTTEEINSGTLDWPFWTKLIVVAIGFTGGLVFLYVQCKMYMQLCLRWRQYNKLINIDNAPEDAQLRAEAAARIKARSGEAGGVVNPVALQEVDSF